ncbi:MAG: hypothetical protein H8E55_72815 [Pelagibacterales bacterium]|nr:hypothetical protein [Pelagibacterales bacterium]
MKKSQKNSLVFLNNSYKHNTFEIIRLDRLLSLITYFEIIIIKNSLKKQSVKNNRITWYKKNLKLLKGFLTYCPKEKFLITPNYLLKEVTNYFLQYKGHLKYFIKSNSKLLKNEKDDYLKTSITRLPRNILSILFYNEYQFFKIQHSYTTIFYLFAIEHKIPLNGSLREYVYNKIKFEQDVQWEYFYKTKKRITIKETRKIINYYLYNNLKQQNIISKSLKNLDSDMKKIRIRLLQISKFNLKKKVKIKKLQNFYYNTLKNYHLLRTIRYIKNKYRVVLKKKYFFLFNELFSNLNYIPEDVNVMDSLSIIPYKNGIYVKSPIRVFNIRLKRYCNRYNFLNRYYPISIKRSSTYTQFKIIKKITFIRNWLAQNKNKNLFNKYFYFIKKKINFKLKDNHIRPDLKKKLLKYFFYVSLL